MVEKLHGEISLIRKPDPEADARIRKLLTGDTPFAQKLHVRMDMPDEIDVEDAGPALLADIISLKLARDALKHVVDDVINDRCSDPAWTFEFYRQMFEAALDRFNDAEVFHSGRKCGVAFMEAIGSGRTDAAIVALSDFNNLQSWDGNDDARRAFAEAAQEVMARVRP